MKLLPIKTQQNTPKRKIKCSQSGHQLTDRNTDIVIYRN